MPRPASEVGPVRAIRMAIGLDCLCAAGPALFTPGPPPAPRAFSAIDTGGLPELRSRNGLLSATLVAAPRIVHIGTISFVGAAFNGAYGGPLLRVFPGDRIRLRLVNQMPDAINLHFHGLRVTPTGTGDNMHILVPPGTAYIYDFQIPPSHPPGLFWYHDHAHRSAEPHVIAGLSGAVLIEGFAAQFTGLAGVPEKLLVLKDWSAPDCGSGALTKEYHCRIVSINGAAGWADAMAQGSTQLWRIANEGANLTIHLAMAGMRLRVIGRDGLPTTAANPVNTIDVMPASRVDVLVQAITPGAHPLYAVGVPTSHGATFSINRGLGEVRVTESNSPAAPLMPIFPLQQDLRPLRVDRRRTIVFSESAAATQYYVNGLVFDPTRTDITTTLGSVEEWTVTNTSLDFHEFHIHQLAFQVLEINHARQPFTGLVDDVRVPEHGEVKLLIPFTDPHIVGHFMFHCHVLNHEDRGMMATIQVLAPGAFHLCRGNLAE